MSLHEFREARSLHSADYGFYALIMAAMWKADTSNIQKLRAMWPDVAAELQARYDAPGGYLPGEAQPDVIEAEA
jgi:uncharacterized protein YdaU (DUF1376 family)